MVTKDALHKKILFHKYVRHEIISDYMENTKWLIYNKFDIYCVVIDGFRRFIQVLHPYPVQLCQFHQIFFVRHYLTKKPELEASHKLLVLVNRITTMDKEVFLCGVRSVVQKA